MGQKQIDLEHRRKAMEIATLKAEEEEQVTRLKKELQHESDEALRKRSEDMRRMNLIFRENDK